MAMGNCDDFVSLIMDYVDGELAGRDRQRLLEHLRQCEHCTSQVQKLRLLRVQLRNLPRVCTSPGFDVGLRARLRADEQARWRKVFAAAPFSSWRVPAFALAVVALCLAAFGALLIFRHGQQLVASSEEGTRAVAVDAALEDDSAGVWVNYVLDSVPMDAMLLGKGVPLSSQPVSGPFLATDSVEGREMAPPPSLKPRLVSF
ncbi:MAG: anti-sigma factor [bacterium]|jgi:anti-sigma factor RsiW|nr:anti-sigma factor [candidate division KSB1 bacterium]MDH7559049.1 anti-sigma factor [bacterium]